MDLSLVGRDNEGDLCFLYSLLQERPAEANISHRQMPSWEDHCAFVRSSPYYVWCLIMDKGERVGSIYLTHQFEIGIHIAKAHQGRGYATAAVKELMSRFPGRRFLANVAPGNEPSHQLWRKLGGKVIQHTYELNS